MIFRLALNVVSAREMFTASSARFVLGTPMMPSLLAKGESGSNDGTKGVFWGMVLALTPAPSPLILMFSCVVVSELYGALPPSSIEPVVVKLAILEALVATRFVLAARPDKAMCIAFIICLLYHGLVNIGSKTPHSFGSQTIGFINVFVT